MNERLMTTDEVAEYFRTVPATVRYWRYLGKGPRSFKAGRRVLYRPSDVEAWEVSELARQNVEAAPESPEQDLPAFTD